MQLAALTSEQIAILRAQHSLYDYARYVSPKDYAWGHHHKILCEAVDQLVDPTNDLRFLLVQMPPRHGKSEIVSRLLPAYVAGRWPNREIVAASYGATLAQDMNQDVQMIMDREEHLEVFPWAKLPTGKIRTGVTRVRNRDAWQLEDPSARGGYRCVGVGGGLTGKGASIAVIDDPVKDWQEAQSETRRDHVWGWYKSVLRTRLTPEGCVLLTMTRWHHDDLAGRLLEEQSPDQWRVISLPAVCEDPYAPHEWRQEGEALWPERFPLEELRPHMSNVKVWSALYQQRPLAGESTMFPAELWEVVGAPPGDALGRVRYWDMAGTGGAGDYTVGVLMSRDRRGIFYVEDVVRGQWAPVEVERAIANTAARDGQETLIAWEEEKGASGKYVSSQLTRALAGFRTRPVAVTGSKEVRAQPYSIQHGSGNVRLVRGSWVSGFVSEHSYFPMGRYDDQVDAASGAFMLASEGDSVSRLQKLVIR